MANIIRGHQGLKTLYKDSGMTSQNQAVGRGIRAYVQALIREGGEQGNAASYSAFQRVLRPAVFLVRRLAQRKAMQ